MRYRYEQNKELQEPKIGDAQGTPKVIFKDFKKPKLGDAPGRHPLFSSSFIGNFTWSYIFIHHMICVLLGASCIILVFAC